MTNKNLISEINMTSLADVSITLLVIFIITAPMMTPGIDVDLPRTDASLPHDEEGITVSINNDKEIFVDNDQVEIDAFATNIKQILAKKPPGIIIYLRADKEVDYGFVVEIVGRMRKAGVTELGLVAEIPPE
ncbi:MAG: biopolymer transporter ExbD [candidate division WOR-3 bacterium]|jgi:biopolymer transport protein TolR